MTVRRTIVEVAKKHLPTGERCFVEDYPKDDEQRSLQIDRATCKQLRAHIREYKLAGGADIVVVQERLGHR